MGFLSSAQPRLSRFSSWEWIDIWPLVAGGLGRTEPITCHLSNPHALWNVLKCSVEAAMKKIQDPHHCLHWLRPHEASWPTSIDGDVIISPPFLVICMLDHKSITTYINAPLWFPWTTYCFLLSVETSMISALFSWQNLGFHPLTAGKITREMGQSDYQFLEP